MKTVRESIEGSKDVILALVMIVVAVCGLLWYSFYAGIWRKVFGSKRGGGV